MKITLLSLIALAGSLPAIAQQNRVSIGLGTLTDFTTSFHEEASRTDQSVRQRHSLPTIGYYRMLNAKTGIGLELGYGRRRWSVNETSPAWHPNVPTTQYLNSQIEADEILVSPNLFTVVTTANRRFRFTPGLSVPVGYTLRSSATNNWRALHDDDGSVLGTNRVERPGQKGFSVGLMLGGAALCRLGGNLYAGLQLGAGFRYSRMKTEGEVVQVTNEGMPGAFRSTGRVNETSEELNFQFQPSVVLNYFF